jgi:nucleoid DNA-binding protein
MAVKRKTKKTSKVKASNVQALKAISKKQSKNEILRAIADETGLTTKQVKQVFAQASHLTKCHLIQRGSGEFAIPEMAIKVVRKTKPATKKREGRNPATGETIMIAAKPKREVIKVRPLKSLKEVLMQG